MSVAGPFSVNPNEQVYDSIQLPQSNIIQAANAATYRGLGDSTSTAITRAAAAAAALGIPLYIPQGYPGGPSLTLLTVSSTGLFDIGRYGALASATDNTTAVQAAITAASAVNGTVIVPPGIFFCIGQLTVPAGTTVSFQGMGRGASILQYTGVTTQPFLILPGKNNGTTFRSLTICGNPAKPAVQILTAAGSGTNGYNSLITFEDCYIGDYLINGAGAAAAAISQWGIESQADATRATDTVFWGRDAAIVLEQGCTDAYFTNCAHACLPQGGEAHQYGLWCREDGTLNFTGTVTLVNCAHSSSPTGIRGSSVVNVIGGHSESTNVIIFMNGGALFLEGGSWSPSSIATHMFQGTGCGYVYLAPGLLSAGAATLSDIANFTGGNAQSVTIEFPDKASIPGVVPAAPLVISNPGKIRFPGYLPFAQTITPAAHAWQNSVGAAVDVYVATAGSYTGTVTLTYQGGAAITIPNPGVGDRITLPPWATLTWGVGGAVTTDPTFNGITVGG